MATKKTVSPKDDLGGAPLAVEQEVNPFDAIDRATLAAICLSARRTIARAVTF